MICATCGTDERSMAHVGDAFGWCVFVESRGPLEVELRSVNPEDAKLGPRAALASHEWQWPAISPFARCDWCGVDGQDGAGPREVYCLKRGMLLMLCAVCEPKQHTCCPPGTSATHTYDVKEATRAAKIEAVKAARRERSDSAA